MPILFNKVHPFRLVSDIETFRVVVIQFTERRFTDFQVFSQVRFRCDLMSIFEVVNELFLLHNWFSEIWHVCPFEMEKRGLSRVVLNPAPTQQHPTKMLIFWIPNKYQPIFPISAFFVVLLHWNNFLRIVEPTPAHYRSHFLFDFPDVLCFMLFNH